MPAYIMSLNPEPKLYIHTPGYPPEHVDAKLLLFKLTGRLREYQIYRYVDGTVHLVHDDYERYIVQIGSRQRYEFTERDAYITFRKEINEFPGRLVELRTTNWEGKLLRYSWYKKFTYSKFRPCRIPKRKEPPEHPFKKYML